MTPPRVRADISWGHIAQLIALVAFVIYLDARSKANEAAIQTALAQIGQQEARLRLLEQSEVRTDERMVAIMNILTRSETKLERIEESLKEKAK